MTSARWDRTSWHKHQAFVSEVFRFEVPGLEQVHFYKVYFQNVEPGEFGAEALRFRLLKPDDERYLSLIFPATRFAPLTWNIDQFG